MACRLLSLAPLLPLALALAGCSGDDEAALPPPTTLVSGQDAPRALFADDNGLYWATGDGAVRTLEHGQSEPRTLGEGQGEVVSLAADDTRVFWMVGGDSGAMRHTNKAGIKEPDEVVAGLDAPRGIGLDESCVFWVTDDAVMAIWKDGGELITVAADSPAPSDVEVDFTGIYWIDATEGGSIWRLQVIGEAPELVTRAPGAERLALGPEHVFWTSASGSVGRAGKDGGAAETLSDGEDVLSALTAAGTGAYWVGSQGTRVRAADDAGAGARTLAEGQAGVADIAVDETSVYWVVDGDGTVVSVAR